MDKPKVIFNSIVHLPACPTWVPITKKSKFVVKMASINLQHQTKQV